MTSGPTDVVTSVREQFGAAAAAYAVSKVHSSGPDLAALVAAAGLTGSERVLDMGCGAGHTALAAAPHAAEVVAVDLSPEMLGTASRLANERGVRNVTFREADVTALPFADATFDVVTSRYSAHHYADPGQAVAEAARVLRPGGRLLLADTMAPEDPALDTFYNAVELLRDRSHVRNWRRSEWTAMMRSAGFTVALVHEMPIELDGDDWVRRIGTSPERTAAIKTVFRDASPAARVAFALKLDGAWGWSIPMSVLRGRLGG